MLNIEASEHNQPVFRGNPWGLNVCLFGLSAWPVRIEDVFYRRPGEQELGVKERIDGFGFLPEYYVITNFGLYNRKYQDRKAYLERNCAPLAEQKHYQYFTKGERMP